MPIAAVMSCTAQRILWPWREACFPKSLRGPHTSAAGAVVCRTTLLSRLRRNDIVVLVYMSETCTAACLSALNSQSNGRMTHRDIIFSTLKDCRNPIDTNKTQTHAALSNLLYRHVLRAGYTLLHQDSRTPAANRQDITEVRKQNNSKNVRTPHQIKTRSSIDRSSKKAKMLKDP